VKKSKQNYAWVDKADQHSPGRFSFTSNHFAFLN